MVGDKDYCDEIIMDAHDLTMDYLTVADTSVLFGIATSVTARNHSDPVLLAFAMAYLGLAITIWIVTVATIRSRTT